MMMSADITLCFYRHVKLKILYLFSFKWRKLCSPCQRRCEDNDENTTSIVAHNRGHFLEETACTSIPIMTKAYLCLVDHPRVPCAIQLSPHYRCEECFSMHGLLHGKLLPVLVLHKRKIISIDIVLCCCQVPGSWISLQHAPTSAPESAYFLKAFWAEITHAENLKPHTFGIVARVYVLRRL